MYTTRTSCRICDGKLREVLSLGDIHISTFVDTNDNPTPKVPITLVQCVDCELMQLLHTVNPDVMYSDYWYQSGLNNSMVIALRDIVEQVKQRIPLLEGDIVIDIGANDGTLLSFYPTGVTTVAYEPSELAQLAYTKCTLTINNFFNADDYLFSKRAKVITAIAMFYDLENPHTFLQDVKKVLDNDGIFIIQMMDFMSMVKYNDFPNLCHEHLEYYTLAVLKGLLAAHNLEIFDIEYNGVNGGSQRTYIQHKNGPQAIRPSVQQALDTERDFFDAIGDVSTYFKDKIETVREKVVDIITLFRGMDKTIAVLGASTKGNTVLQYFQLTSDHIIHAAEINQDKFGKKTIGSDIPIISQTESLKFNPDFYLVLPWGFINNFVQKFTEYLNNGGCFIVPLPEPRLITMDGKGNKEEWLL